MICSCFNGICFCIAKPFFSDFKVHGFDPVKAVTQLVKPLIESLGITAAII